MVGPIKRVLLGTHGQPHEVLVDAADASLLERFRWRVGTGGYVYHADYSGGKKTWLYLHRVIAGATKTQFVDHANRNKLDNRRSNLRTCTRAQNMHNSAKPVTNTSGFKGVSRDWRKSVPWYARIRLGGNRTKYLGAFETPELAHAAYAKAAVKLRGEFGRTE